VYAFALIQAYEFSFIRQNSYLLKSPPLELFSIGGGKQAIGELSSYQNPEKMGTM
jgi:hypothetical protein